MNKAKNEEIEAGQIPDEWGIFKLGQMGKVITGKTPSRDNPTDWGDDYDFITPTDISSNEKYLSAVSRKISKTGFNRFEKIIIPEESVIVTCIGSDMGKVVMNRKKSLTNQQINSIVVSDNFNHDYVYYLLKYLYPILWEHAGGGSTMPIVNKSTFESLKVTAPESMVEQEQIAEILSSLDDKIELNQHINANLEKMASALFKRWFVDFEFPDKNGKPYKTSGGKMIDSELGPIPEGWKVGLLTDFVNVGKGLSYKGSDLNNEGKDALVGLKCFERGGGFRVDGIKRFSGDFKEQHLINRGDLIIAMTDLTQGAEVLGKPAIIPNIDKAGNIIASLDVSILRPKTLKITKAYLFTLFMRKETQDYLFAYSNGSTVLHLSIKGLNEFKLIVASDTILQKFNNIVDPIFENIQILNEENQDLIQARDSFLPRLMSGKIKVKVKSMPL